MAGRYRRGTVAADAVVAQLGLLPSRRGVTGNGAVRAGTWFVATAGALRARQAPLTIGVMPAPVPTVSVREWLRAFIPAALAVLNRQRDHLIDATVELGKFSGLAADWSPADGKCATLYRNIIPRGAVMPATAQPSPPTAPRLPSQAARSSVRSAG